MSNDHLRDLFNETFNNEPIAFDAQSWNKMQSLLDRQQRRSKFWIWLTGGTGFTVIGLACLFLLITEAQAIYQPRGDNERLSSTEAVLDYSPIESIALTAEEEAKNAPSAPIQTKSKIINAQPERAETPPVSNEPAASRSKSSTRTAPSASEPYVDPSGTSSEGESNDPTPKENFAGAEIEEEAEIQNTAESGASVPIAMQSSNKHEDDYLELLPMLPLQVAEVMEIPIISLEDSLSFKKPLTTYIRFGLSSTFVPGIGQAGGIGATKQLGNRVLLSGELQFTRDITLYDQTINSVSYGFDRQEITHRIWTREMLSVELPVLLRVRMNRLTIGTGIAAGILISAKIQEELIGESGDQSIGTLEEVGYVNWKSLQPLHLSVPIDLQYQLTERYFIGSRYTFGLGDGFTPTAKMDRRQRLELYLKMNIQ